MKIQLSQMRELLVMFEETRFYNKKANKFESICEFDELEKRAGYVQVNVYA